MRRARPHMLRLVSAALLTIGLASCGSGAGSVPASTALEPTAAAKGPPEVLTIELEGDGAATFTTEGDAAAGPIARRIRTRFDGLVVSSCLQRAATAHASVDQSLLEHLPLAFTEFALHWAGCPDPSATVTSLLTTEEDDAPLLNHLTEILTENEYTHVGFAKTPAQPPFNLRWSVLLVDRRFELRPVPTTGQPGESLPLQFRLEGDYSRAQIAITSPRGTTQTFEAGLGGGWVVASVPLTDDVGRQWVELIGYGSAGPHVVSLFPIEVGRSVRRTWIGFPRPDESWIGSVDEAESFAAELVHQDRERYGLPRLEVDPALTRIARSHSLEMSSADYFAHVSPATGSVVDRLDAGGYSATFVAENIAMGSSLTEAEESLLRSPGHRAAILSPEATHLGVGVASRRDEGFGTVHFLTQIFVRRPDAATR